MSGATALGPLLDQAAVTARSRFGFQALRPHQAEVLAHVLGGRDCVAVLPTGSGKSLCYAMPALLRPGLVLVVSPLIALIKDQVRSFSALGIRAASVDSHQTLEERDRVWRDLAASDLQLLFVSPERMARPDFHARLQGVAIQLLAVDEAHCISQWGSHFRPDYRLLGEHCAKLGKLQVLAVTATATTRVREDIAATLSMHTPATVWSEFARENLKTKIVKIDKVAEQRTGVLQAVLAQAGSGIVYAPTRKNVVEIHRMLVDAGVKAAAYHAGMDASSRQASQRAFMDDRVRVVVATHAFGLGIDKADIRFVIHAGLPGSLEQYVQEIGRAGRDGESAACWTIYGSRDYHIQKFMIDKGYPEVALLRDMLTKSKAFLAMAQHQSQAGLLRHLRSEIAADDNDIVEALNVLCREGMLTRLRAQGQGFGDTYAEVLIDLGTEDAGAVLDTYPERKLEAMAKLEAMRTFVALTSPRLAYLDEYFRR